MRNCLMCKVLQTLHGEKLSRFPLQQLFFPSSQGQKKQFLTEQWVAKNKKLKNAVKHSGKDDTAANKSFCVFNGKFSRKTPAAWAQTCRL